MADNSVDILVNAKDNTQPAVKEVNSGLARIKRTVFSVQGALAGLAAGVSLGVIANEIQGAAEEIDGVAKVSDKLNIATDELIGLQHAASLAGASAGVMDKGLEKMNVNLGKAIGGSKSANEAFEGIGLSAAKLAGLPTDEKFRQIADAINKLPSAHERATAAQNIFGKSGMQLLNTISLGSKGLRENTEEARKLGIAYDRVDAAKVEAANDAISRVGVVFTGIKNQAAIELAPVIEAVAKKFTDWASQGDGLKAWMPGLKQVASGIGIVADVVDLLRDVFKATQASITSGIAIFIRGWSDAGKAVEAFLDMLPGVDVEFNGTLHAMADDLDRLAKEQWEEAKQSFAAPPPSAGITKFFDDLKREADAAAAAMVKANDEKKRLEGFEGARQAASAIGERWKTGAMAIFKGVKTATTSVSGTVADGVKTGLWETGDKQLEKMRNEAEKLKKSVLNPQGTFDGELQKAKNLLKRGLITQAEFDTHKEKLRADMVGGIAKPTGKDSFQKASLAAVESRALTRAPGASDPNLVAQKQRDRQIKALEATNRKLDALLKQGDKQNGPKQELAIVKDLGWA